MEDLRKRLDNFLKEQGYSPIDVTMGEKKIRIARVEDPKAVYAEFEAIKQELVRLNGGITTAEKSGKEMNDAEVTKLLIKTKKGLQESLTLREDPTIRQELEVVESYLPKAMSREEIHYQCRQIMAGMPKELPDAARIGKTMGEFNKRFPGQADPKEVMNIIKML